MTQVIGVGDESPSPLGNRGDGQTRETSLGIQYPVAEEFGHLVWASELAEIGRRSDDLICVSCSSAVQLKAGSRRRAHFSHRPGVLCTASESVLHATTIRVLHNAITAAVGAGDIFPLGLGCDRCGAERDGNLAKHVGGSLDIEKVLEDGIRPDLLVRDADGRPRFVIEVIVTHPPEPQTLELYRDLKLPVVEVWPSWGNLADIRSGLPAPQRRGPSNATGFYSVTGTTCSIARHSSAGLRRCPRCQQPARLLGLEIVAIACYRCRKDVRILDVIDHTGEELVTVAAGSPDLTGIETIAREVHVTVRRTSSKAAGGTYLMHHCGWCDAKQGDNFIYQPDDGSVVLSEPIRFFTYCTAGHWEQERTREWGAGTSARRVGRVRDLVGERNGRAEAFVSIQSVTSRDVHRVVRSMMGGW